MKKKKRIKIHSKFSFPKALPLKQPLLFQFEGQRTDVLPLLTHCKRTLTELQRERRNLCFEAPRTPRSAKRQTNLKQTFKHSHSHPDIDKG